MVGAYPNMRRAPVECESCKEPIIDFEAWLSGHVLCAWCEPRECSCCGRQWTPLDDPEFGYWGRADDIPDECFACRQDPESEPLVAVMEGRS